MSAFEYTALDAQGRELRGVLEGDSARQIRQLLREQALLPVTVSEVSDAPTRKSFQFSFGNRIRTADLALLTRQLSTLVRPASRSKRRSSPSRSRARRPVSAAWSQACVHA
jgi:general secretion pathway protein F